MSVTVTPELAQLAGQLGTDPATLWNVLSKAVAALAETGAVPATRQVATGTGLTGGGDLSADRTLSLVTPVAVANGGSGAATAAANTVFAGRSTAGTAVAPTWRTLVAADIPSLSSTYMGTWVAAPASSGAAGTAGQLAYDTGFLYVCVATNTWLKVAIATW